MEPTELLPIVAVLSLITVEFGGHALLRFATREDAPPGPEERRDETFRFFRAGHAHAGVLLVLSLVYFLYLERTDYGDGMRWLAGLVLTAGILAQPGGFFVHMGMGAPDRATAGTTLTRVGAVVIAVALVLLAIGLIRAL